MIELRQLSISEGASLEPSVASDCPNSPGLRRESLKLMRVQHLMWELVEQRADPQLHYLDDLSLFGSKDACDLPEDVHPNPAGYILMGQRFDQLVTLLDS
jgi:hypothetical protein